MPLPPHPSLHLSVSLSDSDGDELRRAAEEDEDELIVLDPEHPLMKRFQTALKNHLHKQLERLNMELQQKALQTPGLSGGPSRDRHAGGRQARTGPGSARGGPKQRSHVSQLQSEVDNLALRLFYMQEVNADLRSDITAMKNASRRAHSEKTQAEEQKHKQETQLSWLENEMAAVTLESSDVTLRLEGLSRTPAGDGYEPPQQTAQRQQGQDHQAGHHQRLQQED